ncbi:MAG TPA: 2-amino-4-hydroxy-6-hydroxymethyldihydropteridine diphosphokinase [Candidatus Acidoferrum sp.]|nr:2-amino-4-hydroxy-6-hydroxymethyldihydropteridine diphosphokinase [Candidatus Acidoferrum sp.]
MAGLADKHRHRNEQLDSHLHESKSHTVYLSLGSNLGDRVAILRTAIDSLASAGAIVKNVSSLYETEPKDFLAQPWFLNCVVEAQTSLAPLELLRALRGIEALLGSKKEFAKGPRLLDIDILLYGDESIDSPELQMPHPRMLERKFVLAPLAEIAPRLKHPSWPTDAAGMLARSADQSQVKAIDSR